MLGESAVRLYDFDRDELVKIAERIGPKIEDIQKPL